MRDSQLEYYLLLGSREWEKFRRALIKSRGNTCEKCGKKLSAGLQVHHKCYRWGLKPWEYPEEDLLVLCRDCHRSLHLEMQQRGYRVPVFGSDGITRKVPDSMLCKHCCGHGHFEEYEHILGGICLHCFGTGIRYSHFYTKEEADILSHTIYKQWEAFHMVKGFPEEVKFEKGPKEVKRWLLKMNETQ